MSSEHLERAGRQAGSIGPRRSVWSGPAGRSAGGGGNCRGPRGVAVRAAVLGAVAVLSGCGGPASPAGATSGAVPAPPATSSVAAPAPGASNAPDPNAPEVVAAGDIPDNQVFVAFTAAGGLFTVSVPQGWAQSSDGAATVFTDKFNSVRIETMSRPVAPDVGSVRAQEVPRLQGSMPGFVLRDVQSVQRSAGSAVLLTYEAPSAPNPVTGKSVTEAVERYTFWRGGQEAVLTLSGAKGADNVDPWRKITDSLRWQQ